MSRAVLHLKKIKDQVIVITGASSGIGLATAMMAAKQGAAVVLASRNTADLVRIAREINESGGRALPVTCDVSRIEDVEHLGQRALEHFGRIDTWINNAGGGMYGFVLDHPISEAKQVFETNFWGLHYGCRVAVKAMKSTGGMIINLGSEVSERAVAMQTMYSASKQAIRGYTEGLRTELEKAGIPIGVTLVRPAAIDTPYPQHAVNHLKEGEPSLPPPVYHPDVAAKAILACAEIGKRDVYIGGASKFVSVLEHFFPRLIDYAVEAVFVGQQERGTKIPHRTEYEGLMHAPVAEGELRGGHKGYVAQTSLWTWASLHPFASTALLAGVTAGGLMLAQRLREHEEPSEEMVRQRVDPAAVDWDHVPELMI